MQSQNNIVIVAFLPEKVLGELGSPCDLVCYGIRILGVLVNCNL